MEQFWYCDRCGSMNRADSRQCYKCRAGKAIATAGTSILPRSGADAAPALDGEHLGTARALMSTGSYVSAWQIGYLTAFMTIAAVVVEAIYVTVALFHAATGSPGYSPQGFPWFETPPDVLGLTFTALVVISLILQGLFLSLTSMNSPALGSGTAGFGPARCAIWPLETVVWAFWGLFTRRRRDKWLLQKADMPSGISSATHNPPRLLNDLMNRLWVPGRSGARLVAFWSAAWSVLVLMGYLLIFALVLALIGTPLPFKVLIALSSGAVAWCLLTLAAVIIEMARRQHIREQWVLGGLPAPAGQAANAPDGALVAPIPSPVVTATPASFPASRQAPEPVASTWRRSAPIAKYEPPGESISWSRPVERLSQSPEPDQQDHLPAVWRQAIERTVPEPTQGQQTAMAEETSAPSDRRVIQPSSFTVPRYRSPFADTEPDPPADLDLGGQI